MIQVVIFLITILLITVIIVIIILMLILKKYHHHHDNCKTIVANVKGLNADIFVINDSKFKYFFNAY